MTVKLRKIPLKRELDEYFPEKKLNLFIHEKQYWKHGKSKAGEEPPKEPVSNFIIEHKGFVESEFHESKRLIRLVSTQKTTPYMAVDTKCFTSTSAFTEFLESKGSFFFEGNKIDLLNLKKLAFESGKEYIEAEVLGYHQRLNLYVFSNGVIKDGKFLEPDEFGLINGIYIPASIKENRYNPEYLTQRKFEYLEGSKYENFGSWFKDMSRVHGRNNMLVCTAFMLASLNFDEIALKRKFFPILCIAGQKGSGKGTLTRALLSLFSREPDQTMINNSTSTAFMRKLEQYANVPVWFDEFKNSLQERKIETLKNIYDIIGRTTGVKSNDARTRQTRVMSPIILTGQEFPTNEALLSRCAILNLKVKENPTDQEKADFNALEEECAKGLGKVLLELMQFRKVLLDDMTEDYYETRKMISQHVNKRQIKANSRLLDIYGLLGGVLIKAYKNGLHLDFLEGFAKGDQETILCDIFTDFIAEQSQMEAQADEVMVFWQIFESMTDNGILKRGIDYKCDYENQEFYIRNSVFDSYMKYYREVNAERSVDKKSLMKYLEQKSYYKAHSVRKYFDSLIGEETQRSRAWVFDLVMLEQEGVIFD